MDIQKYLAISINEMYIILVWSNFDYKWLTFGDIWSEVKNKKDIFGRHIYTLLIKMYIHLVWSNFYYEWVVRAAFAAQAADLQEWQHH